MSSLDLGVLNPAQGNIREVGLSQFVSHPWKASNVISTEWKHIQCSWTFYCFAKSLFCNYHVIKPQLYTTKEMKISEELKQMLKLAVHFT